MLDSYTAERQPVFSQIGEELIAGGILRERAWLREGTTRKATLPISRAHGSSGQSTGAGFGEMEPHYAGSPVVVGEPGAKKVGIHSAHGWVARAGHHLSPSTLSSGKNVFEELGTNFTLLAFDADEGAVRDFEQAASEQRDAAESRGRDSAADERQRYEASLILLRPDQFVAWSDNGPGTEPKAIIKHVVGA